MMNHYILIAILLIICVLMGFYIHKIDIENNNLSYPKNVEVDSIVLEIPSDIDTLTNDNHGNIYVFKNNDYWKLVNGKVNETGNINNKWNIPKDWNNIDVVTWDNSQNNIVFIKNNKVYTNKNDIIQKEQELGDYWIGLSKNDKNFDSILNLNNSVLFINKDKYIEYDTINNKKIRTGYLKDKFNGFNFSNIDGIFINKNEHNLNDPSGSINFVKGNKYYRYDFAENNLDVNGTFFNTGVIEPTYIKYNFTTLGNNGVFPPKNTDNLKYNDKVVSINNGIQSWIVQRDSNYRIICSGAGKANAGLGAKVFNDLRLKKGDRVDVLVGQSGSNLPMANIANDSKLNKMGSSSGSGASYVWVNDKLTLVAGGGGGWSSEIYRAPESCNALKYDEDAVPLNGKVHIPIKKILITCENANNHSKIILNDIKLNDESNFNNIKIKESPALQNIFKKNFIGETTYSKTPPVIEIELSDYLIDYSIDVDFDILTNRITGKDSVVSDIVKVYGTDGDVYTIYDFNKKYNGRGITAELLLSEKLGYIPKCVERNNQLINDNQAHSGGNIDNPSKKSIIQTDDKNTIVINGGFGGGGAVSCQKSNLNFSNCGGGGGFLGGNSGVSNINEDINGNKYEYKTINDREIEIDTGENKVRVKIPYVSATGGTSYVAPSNIDKVLANTENYKANWFNALNSDNGFVTIILLKDLHKKIEPKNNEEYISKTYNVIKKNATEKQLNDVELKLVDTMYSTNNENTVTGISSISNLDSNYNIKSLNLVVKSKDIDTSTCSTMKDVFINSDLYKEKMINRNTNPIVDKSFYKISSLRGICDDKITVIKFPISNRVNLRNVKINIDLESDDIVDFSGMFHYIFVKENSVLRYMSYLNRPEEDIIPDDLLSFNVSRERCNLLKNKEDLFEEMASVNVAGFSNNYQWENIKNTISQNMKKYPKYLENDQNFNLLFDKNKHEGRIFEIKDNYKANIKTKWGNVEPGFLYILLNNNNRNNNVYYNVSFVEYDKNGVTTFDYLKLLEAPNIEAGKMELQELKNKREYISYAVNKQIEDIMNDKL